MMLRDIGRKYHVDGTKVRFAAGLKVLAAGRTTADNALLSETTIPSISNHGRALVHAPAQGKRAMGDI